MYSLLFLVLTTTCSLAYPMPIISAITSDLIKMIAPNSASCTGASFTSECRNASQAAPLITKSFATYGIFQPNEAAALISLMAFESTDFRYQKNHWPGTPGQGTRNMQSAKYNALYASSIRPLAPSISTITGDSSSDTRVDQILDLLLQNDEYDFGSAAWFLSTQCDSTRNELKTGGSQGWETWLETCVGTQATDARRQYYMRAINALGDATIM